MGSGTQLFVIGGTSWSVKNDTKYECITKVNVPEYSSQSMSIKGLIILATNRGVLADFWVPNEIDG